MGSGQSEKLEGGEFAGAACVANGAIKVHQRVKTMRGNKLHVRAMHQHFRHDSALFQYIGSRRTSWWGACRLFVVEVL